MIQPARMQVLVDAPARQDSRYVLYWMQAAQRAGFNPALEYAVEAANALGLPTLVCFGLTRFPDANARHYDFMLRGLAETEGALRKRGIGFLARKQSPDRLARDLAADAALVVCDRGYLRIQRGWRDRLAEGLDRRLEQVEGEVVVPVETASSKHEYAARTLRPKIHRLWDDYLQPLRQRPVKHRADHLRPGERLDLSRPERAIAGLAVDRGVGPVRRFEPGEAAARRRLAAFIEDPLPRYETDRGRPEAGAVSHLSPYLHFGQISPVEIALAARESGARNGVAAFLEELIVRRELAMNHAFFEPRYDAYASVPEWARKTLAGHADDARPHLYAPEAFEAGETHDPIWNAAMLEMRATGYMHNRLRMYWGKKILEWSESPETAFETTLALNNRWFLDGRDANSFTNVGWIFGLHDRPWGPRPVFGTVRSMGAGALKGLDAMAYAADVRALAEAEGAEPPPTRSYDATDLSLE